MGEKQQRPLTSEHTTAHPSICAAVLGLKMLNTLPFLCFFFLV